MRIGGSAETGGGAAPSSTVGRSGAGEASAIINRRIVARLRETDEELRAKLRREALSNSGVPHFVDTRGPDLGLYTVDGTVVRGLLPKGAGQSAAAANPTRKFTSDSGGPRSEEAKKASEPAVRQQPGPAPVLNTGNRGAEAYSPRPQASVGGTRDITI